MTTKSIWKWDLEIVDEQAIKCPRGTKFISAGLDPNGKLCVWAEVDPLRESEDRGVTIVGTGNHTGAGTFLGTVVMPPFVWHVYVK